MNGHLPDDLIPGYKIDLKNKKCKGLPCLSSDFVKNIKKCNSKKGYSSKLYLCRYKGELAWILTCYNSKLDIIFQDTIIMEYTEFLYIKKYIRENDIICMDKNCSILIFHENRNIK